MKALRSILKIMTEEVTISIPQELQNRRVEIILLPADEAATDLSPQSPKGTLENILEAAWADVESSQSLDDFKKSIEEIRHEWE